MRASMSVLLVNARSLCLTTSTATRITTTTVATAPQANPVIVYAVDDAAAATIGEIQ